MKSNEYNEAEVLEQYVLTHYSGLFTRLESLGFKAASADEKASNSSGRQADMLREKWGAENNPEVVAALSKGVESFRRAVYARLMEEHSSEIYVNRCPSCTNVVRTPKAKQCQWCFHSWHE